MHVFPWQRSFPDQLLDSPMTPKMLSTKIENKQFQLLFDASSIPNRALLISAFSNLAASWLSIIPPPGLNLHLDTAEPNSLTMVARYRHAWW